MAHNVKHEHHFCISMNVATLGKPQYRVCCFCQKQIWDPHDPATEKWEMLSEDKKKALQNRRY